MRKNRILRVLMASALGIAIGVTGCNKSEPNHRGGHSVQYTCPMKEHADVISDKPGNCPKCGMKLVEKK